MILDVLRRRGLYTWQTALVSDLCKRTGVEWRDGGLAAEAASDAVEVLTQFGLPPRSRPRTRGRTGAGQAQRSLPTLCGVRLPTPSRPQRFTLTAANWA